MLKKYIGFSRVFSLIFIFIFFAISCFIIYVGVNAKKTNDSFSETATATIISIDNDNNVKVQFEYDGQTYTAFLDYYSSNMMVGETKTIHFNADNPLNISTTTFSNIFIIVGVAFAVISAGTFIGTIVINRKYKNAREEKEELFNEVETTSNNSINDFGFPNDCEETYYCFLGRGELKGRFCLQDATKNLLYEARQIKFRLLKPCDFEFINYKRGIKTSHKVGGCVTKRINGYATKSSFKFDDVDIWTHLDEMGICFKSNAKGLTNLEYEVIYKNRYIGKIVTTGSDVYGESQNKLTHIPIRGFYRINTCEEYLDVMFLLAFTFSRTEMSYQEL